MGNTRYSHLETLEQTAERTVERAKDTWGGGRVIRKTSDLASSLRESKVLLALPDGVAPRLLDMERTGSDLTLVLEEIPGETLSFERPIPAEKIPQIVLTICSALAQIHRIGWVHGDLKPPHIRITEGRRVRLLDFGYALDMFGDMAAQTVGGTPPYLAPELWKGWLFDGRADQFSLGVLLSEISPRLEEDPRWARLLARLTSEVPARRYPDVVALRKAVSREFGLPAGRERFPRFGVGPMRGREDLVASVVRRVRGKAASRVLIQARPGTGLSRFLLEVMVGACAGSAGEAGAAKRHGWPTRMIDLGSACSREMASRVHAYLKSPESREGTILLGIGDPSPGLHWGPEHIRSLLGDMVRDEGWERIALPPIDLESMREIVATSLGSMDGSSDELARLLWEKTEGDLKAAAGGFRSFVERNRREQGLTWTAPPKPRRWSWSAPPFPPTLDPVATDIATAVAVLARAGPTFYRRLGSRLLQQFCLGVTIDDVQSHGYVERVGSRRLRFVTRRFWEGALARPPARATEIDRCVCQSDPDLHDLDEVFHFCALALRIGKREKAAAWLGQALALADLRRGYIDIVRVLSFPDPAPTKWTRSRALRRIGRLGALLGPSWSEERLWMIVGKALQACGQKFGGEILERAAAGRDETVALDALLLLADEAVRNPKDPAYARYRDSIRSLAKDRGARGALCFFEARATYFGAGRLPEAMALAQEASRLMKGSDLSWEILNYQLLAAIESDTDPRKALMRLHDALAAVKDPERRLQIYHNAGLILGRAGRSTEAADMIGQAIHEGAGRVALGRLIGLRNQRAWHWADNDAVQPARAEAYALLEHAPVRLSPRRLGSVQALIAFCDMHLGNIRESGRHLVRAMSACDATAPGIWNDCLRQLADVVVDFEAWDLLDECGELLERLPEGEDALSRTCAARIRAVRYQAKGESSLANETLKENLAAARTLTFSAARLRYLHHLGLLHAAEAERTNHTEPRRAAVRLFEEELRELPRPGNGYFRIRALLSLGSVLMPDDRPRALSMYTKAVALARAIQSPSLLRMSLESRMKARGTDVVRDRRGRALRKPTVRPK